MDFNHQYPLQPLPHLMPKFSLGLKSCQVFFSASFFARFAYLYMISLYFKK